MQSDLPNDAVRLNKYLAEMTGRGRREIDELISKGRVTLNGEAVRLGQRIDPERDVVQIDDKTLRHHQRAYTYIMLNKPVGYVCSRRSQGGDPTIYALLPPSFHSLKSVGRLDRDSSGLLLLTDDGSFAHQLTHPSFKKQKSYDVTLDKPLQPLHRQMISDYGVVLDDGPSKLLLEHGPVNDNDSSWRVTMHEGRNRQIRRTFGALGYNVTKLHRTTFGRYILGDLPAGHLQEISTH